MRIEFSQKALGEFTYFETNAPKIAQKIGLLIQDIVREPYRGLGKPEPLKYDYNGCWSRRITDEHRLVYYLSNRTLYIVQCRYHYTKH